jgi:mono/diheme cytochrome c family protein
MKKFGTILMTAVFVLGFTAFASAQDFKIPAKDKAMKSPIESNKETLKEGKAIFDMHCKACHGAKGLGDGPKAKSMKGDLGDFSSAKFQAQTDGELFYIVKEGKGDHPSFAKKLSDEDKWLCIVYVRSLKK